MDYMLLANLVFSLVIFGLAVRRFTQSEVRAFLLVGIGFLLFAVSHFSLLMGWTEFRAVLTAVRTAGYLSVLVGLVF